MQKSDGSKWQYIHPSWQNQDWGLDELKPQLSQHIGIAISSFMPIFQAAALELAFKVIPVPMPFLDRRKLAQNAPWLSLWDS